MAEQAPTPTLDELRARITGPEATPADFRNYAKELRATAARERVHAEHLDNLADAAYRHASSMPQSTDERVRSILERV